MDVDGDGDASSKMDVGDEKENTPFMIMNCKFSMKMKMIESARKQVSYSLSLNPSLNTLKCKT